MGKQPPNIFMLEILLVQVSQFCYLLIIIITIKSCRGLNVYFVPLGLYGIDLRQHPQAQLISDALRVDDIRERFVVSR